MYKLTKYVCFYKLNLTKTIKVETWFGVFNFCVTSIANPEILLLSPIVANFPAIWSFNSFVSLLISIQFLNLYSHTFTAKNQIITNSMKKMCFQWRQHSRNTCKPTKVAEFVSVDVSPQNWRFFVCVKFSRKVLFID